MRSPKKFLPYIGLLGLVLVIILGFQFPWQKEFIYRDSLLGNIAAKLSPIPTKVDTTMLFVGDIMMTRGVESSVNKNFAGDYSQIFVNASYLKDSDITFANLEGDVSDLGKNVGSKYSFRMDPAVIAVLEDAGFDILSFANNHVGDWTKSAFDDTRARLTAAGILYTGAGDTKTLAETPVVIVKNGTKIGFLGFSDVGPDWLGATDTSSGILLASDKNFDEIIKNARSEVDVLIVSIHGGIEYNVTHTARQTDLAHRAIDDGALLLIGHHPHVAEEVEEYHDGLIVYSLGNYIFDQSFSENTMKGLNVLVTLEDNKIKDYKLYESHQNVKFQIESVTPLEK